MGNTNILLGVTGGIAAYKACGVAGELLKSGLAVRVVMTRSATEFVRPGTFQALTGRPVHVGLFDPGDPSTVVHIELAKWADVLLIAPATANMIGKLASGIADDLLSTVALALPAGRKTILAPAMNVEMWQNPIVQRNITLLKSFPDRFGFIDPRSGLLACGDTGTGKIADTKTIVGFIKDLLERN